MRCSENPRCSAFLYTARCLPLSGGQKARGLSEERERGRMPGERLSNTPEGLSSFLRETDQGPTRTVLCPSSRRVSGRQ